MAFKVWHSDLGRSKKINVRNPSKLTAQWRNTIQVSHKDHFHN